MSYEKNRNLINIKYPHLLKELSGTAVNSGINLETGRSRTGMPVLRVTKNERKLFLNSAYDPELEAERWAERRGGNAKGALILCGGGFLYHLKAILKTGRYQKVVCYEPVPAILKACLQEVDLTEVNGDYLLITGNNYNEAAGLVSQYLMYLMLDAEISVLPSYQELFSGEIAAFQNALRESVRITRLNLATASLFGEQWITNAAKNLPTITKSPGVGHFFNQFNGVPAIVVSAGPSLEKNIHLLNDIKEKAVIICAGTSIRAMQKFGVTPHFLVAFDGTDYNKKIYADLNLDEICLVYNYRYNHDALNYFGGRKLYMKLDTETFSDFLSLKYGGYEFGAIRSGFSVAHPSLDLAIKFGCSPVILIGQDLAYTGDKRYAESQYQQIIDRSKLPANCFITKDIYGQDIVTDNQLDSFRRLFELMVTEYYQGKKILNATEGGQPIKGVPNHKLADVIGEYCRRDREIGHKIEELYQTGLRSLRRRLPHGFDLVAQIRNLAGQGCLKMEALLDRVQQLRQTAYTEESVLTELKTALNKIAGEYEALTSHKEWQLLLKDLKDWKIAPNQIALATLGMIMTNEAFDTALQYWTNILGETKKYLENIIERLADGAGRRDAGVEPEAPSIVQIASAKSWEQFAESVGTGGALNDLQFDLENVINQSNRKDLNRFRYLYGLVLFKKKEISKAVLVLEQVQKQDGADAKVNFLLYRCYRRLQNFAKAQDYLGICLKLGYRPEFCRRMLAKNAYRAKNYIAANNYLTDFSEAFEENYLYKCMRIDCLKKLLLHTEAQLEFQEVTTKFQLRNPVKERLQRLLAEKKESEYERNYRSNIAFFEKRGFRPGDFAEVHFKICNYLGNEYIYNTDSKRFLLAVNEPRPVNLEITASDTLLICDTDDPSIYNHLKRVFQESQTEMRQALAFLPVFIVERQPQNWELMMQKFDFNELADWQNLHFIIGTGNDGLEQALLEDNAPLPNILYGTELDGIKQLLEKVKELKENSYRERLTMLQEYYRKLKPNHPNKILIITSFSEKTLLNYGEALHLYLKEQGLESELYYESAPYYKFSKYADLNLMERFRPDLVVHLFAVAEELETYKNLDVAFISWRIIDRWLVPNITSEHPMEKVLISGESKVNSGLNDRGFGPEQIKPVLLPYLPEMMGEISGQPQEIEIAITKDLDDYERILGNLAATIMGMPVFGLSIAGEDVINICRSIYFRLLTGLLNQGSLAPDNQFYLTVVRDELLRKNRKLETQMLQLVAGLFQRELENTLLNFAQAKWLINNNSKRKIGLYGAGWEKDLSFQPYRHPAVQLFSVQHHRVISQSKINIYTDLMLRNNSYLQPDLINGLAGGGFFLVNGSLIRTVGEKVLEPFAGLLEIYRNREELLEKVDYFLKNETEREERGRRLQQHILENFKISGVAGTILDSFQETANGRNGYQGKKSVV